MKLNFRQKLLIYLFACIIIGLIIIGNRPVIVDDRPPVAICHQRDCYELMIADTAQARETGLAGRESMDADQAMLFVFAHSGHYAFWMKGMLFDLDIIWLEQDLTIVAIERGAKACSEAQDCPILEPYANAKYVLEVASGQTQDWRIGERLRFKK